MSEERTQPAKEEAKHWDVFAIYQEGKMKRYSLLFSINGGAYAVITWMAEHPDKALGPVASLTSVAVVVPLAAALFTALMFVDIWMFGQMMRKHAPKDGLEYFSAHGKAVLTSIVLILSGAWAALLVSTKLEWLAVIPALALAGAIAWIFCSGKAA